MPLDPTANRLRYLILAIQAEGGRRLDASLQAAGIDLTSTQSEVVEVLHDHGELSQHELAEQLVCTKGNISRLLDRMQAKGLVRREPDAQNRRRVTVSLTEHGHRTYEAAEPILEALLTSLADLFRDAELQQLTDLLSRIADTFDLRLADHVSNARTAAKHG